MMWAGKTLGGVPLRVFRVQSGSGLMRLRFPVDPTGFKSRKILGKSD